MSKALGYIVSLFVYLGTIFIFFLLLGLVAGSHFSSDTPSKTKSSREYSHNSFAKQDIHPSAYNEVITSSSPPSSKQESEIDKILQKLSHPKKAATFKNENYKESYPQYLKRRYSDEIKSVKTYQNGKIIEISSPLFVNNKKIYDFHRRIVDSLKKHSFEEVRYRWYNSQGDYTIFNLK